METECNNGADRASISRDLFSDVPTPLTENHPSLWQHGKSAEFIHAEFARKLERQRKLLMDSLHRCAVWMQDGLSEVEKRDAAEEAVEVLKAIDSENARDMAAPASNGGGPETEKGN